MMFRATLSSTFLLMGGLMLGSLLGVGSLVSHLGEDGTVQYFKDSAGSMSGQNDYLGFPLFFALPLLVRLFRSTRRLTVVELLLHLMALGLIAIAVFNVGTQALRYSRNFGQDADSFRLLFMSGKATCVLSVLLILDRFMPSSQNKSRQRS